ncbi:zinc finger protein 282-like isoform X2 [Pleurodeles waltl]|uniref:zinc finger protein 282-like isoform X2 n=1 Tax=Pleurodeles waltl TaxID=8319 RepID=UPI003709AF26
MSVKKSLERHETSRLDADEVYFHDVSAYFSEEEWTLLQEWQKELYRNVMKEIHQALISLGPLIATAVCSVRTKEKEEMFAVDKQSSESKPGIYSSPSDTIANPDALLRIKRENSQPLSNSEDAGRVDIDDCFRTGPLIATAVCSVTTKEKEEMCAVDKQRSEGTPGIYSSPSDTIANPDALLRIKRENSQPLSNSEDGGGVDMDDCFRTGLTGSACVEKNKRSIGFTFLNTDCVKKEDQVSISVDQHGTEMEGCGTDPTSGEPIANRKRKTGDSTEHYEGTTSRAFTGIINKTMFQSSNKDANSRSQMWSECYQNLQEEKTTQGESCFSKLVDLNPPTIGGSDESSWRNSRAHEDLPSIEPNQRTCIYSNCDDKSYNPTEVFIKHIRTNSRVRPYACTECEKSFFHKSHLNTHNRVHSGEKPYICNFCPKSFHRKDNLDKHIRTHTGERPYTCPKCEKTFIQRSHLREHLKKHNRTL